MKSTSSGGRSRSALWLMPQGTSTDTPQPLRRRLGKAALALSAAALAGPGRAQANFPARPVRMIIPYPPGGSGELLGRPIAKRLTEVWGQPVVLDFKPGAGGTIATDALAKSPPDGHAFIMVLAAHAINPSLYPKLPYDTTKDMTCVALVVFPQPSVAVHVRVEETPRRVLLLLREGSCGF